MQEERIKAANDLTVSATLRPPTFCLILRAITSSCASEPCRSRISLREEGEVALLESPNGLGATAEFQLRGEVSRTKFPAMLCRPSTSLGNERTDRLLFAVCPRARANKMSTLLSASCGRLLKAASGLAPRLLLIVGDHLRRGFAQFNLLTDLLDLRGLLFHRCHESFDFPLLLGVVRF